MWEWGGHEGQGGQRGCTLLPHSSPLPGAGGDGEPLRGDHRCLCWAGARGPSQRQGFPGCGELERVERRGPGDTGQRCEGDRLKPPASLPGCAIPPQSPSSTPGCPSPAPSSWHLFPQISPRASPRSLCPLKLTPKAGPLHHPKTGPTVGDRAARGQTISEPHGRLQLCC